MRGAYGITLPALPVMLLLAWGGYAVAATPVGESKAAQSQMSRPSSVTERVPSSGAPEEGNAPVFVREEDGRKNRYGTNHKIRCPNQLRLTVSVNDPDTKGWIVGGTDQISPLKSARLFVGPPIEETIQRYNELTAIPFMDRDYGEFQQTWTFDEQMFQSGILLVCDYAGSNRSLMRPIPPGIKECKEVDVIDDSADTAPIVFCR